ncbi:type II toxin-antitoxin system Phd/YefM family antitoxin [Nocardia sp. CNY236]|uniref:type II toxin-antitoxin system Phd/YefM family antitoxin n=1 Tax=Nocardia sp. CNY236 TaxID=1169152 RepID=UPI0004100073|nr:type II toxin-antitoxin system Phd/YefM family antitoxin [Nocardia sp. CNY236]
MPALPISTVRQNLFGLVQQVNDDHDPLTVVTKSGENAVLVAESDWNSLMETLYVLQTHGGVHLLKSAQDARRGCTDPHTLFDPDAESIEMTRSTEEDMQRDELSGLSSVRHVQSGEPQRRA